MAQDKNIEQPMMKKYLYQNFIFFKQIYCILHVPRRGD